MCDFESYTERSAQWFKVLSVKTVENNGFIFLAPFHTEKTQRNKKVITQKDFSMQTLHKRSWKECKRLTAGWKKIWGLISQTLLICIKKAGNPKENLQRFEYKH